MFAKKTASFILLLITGLFNAARQVQAQISANVILRLENLLTHTPGGDAAAVGCKIASFVDNCVANNIEGVSVELKRSDVNMNAASPQLGHIYWSSTHTNTAGRFGVCIIVPLSILQYFICLSSAVMGIVYANILPVYTGKGYDESFLFDLLTSLRAVGIKVS